ncbi:hypothetical protein [Streptomyces sp. CB00455]|uniref:hypothetical protein n=1 Tax=Streptomyces sp. CB00455 TaxID=1703927 RepID=UPI001300EA4D|nr:hypothetical protein [Streptomyces sp. CB00455]
MRRWSLPLLLAALLAASGCVTVHPTSLPPAGARAAVAADHKIPAASRPLRPGTEVALPLSPLPASSSTAPAGQAPEQDRAPGPHKPAEADRENTGRARHTGPALRPTAGPGTARPRGATAVKRTTHPTARPKAKAKARPKTPAPHRRARPTGPWHMKDMKDMKELCRVADGVTSPAITSLCHQTYR